MHIQQLAAFGLGIFTGSTLLFLVQPLFSKMVMPLLGGAPAIWNTLMLFFQAVLLLGYTYVHLSTRILGVKKQGILHLLLLLVSLSFLPLALPEMMEIPVESELPIYWVLTLAATVVGLPFFMLSSNAPLMQIWFAHTRHKHREDPYFLYAVSNAGSLLALLSYPFVVQPLFDLVDQSFYWSVCYGALTVVALAALVLMWRDYEEVKEPEEGHKPVQMKERFWWLVLAMLPSSYLLGVTTFVTTDIASTPLLWVIPLALYLITFILAFMKKQLISDAFIHKYGAILAMFAVVLAIWNQPDSWINSIIHLAVFFLICLGCHQRLARRSPSVKHLTEFYFWISLGGVLGGVFNAIVAPTFFNAMYEYGIVFGLAIILALSSRKEKWQLRDVAIALFVLFAVTMIKINLYWGPDEELVFSLNMLSLDEKTFIQMILVVLFFGMLKEKALRLGLAFGGILVMLVVFPQHFRGHEIAERSFFASYRLEYIEKQFAFYLWSGNGVTVQGKQSILPGERNSTLYFYPLEGVRDGLPESTISSRMGVIGLGVGSMACLGPKEIDFFEIDPVVKRMAEEDNFFTYLSECGADYTITLGDGRRKMQEKEDDQYGVVVLDAFNSNAIPTHLLTREAFEMYLSKMKEDGVLLINITNSSLNFKPLIAAVAEEMGMTVIERKKDEKRASTWVMMARNESDFGQMLSSFGEYWQKMPEQKKTFVWSDGHSTILPLFKFL